MAKNANGHVRRVKKKLYHYYAMNYSACILKGHAVYILWFEKSPMKISEYCYVIIMIITYFTHTLWGKWYPWMCTADILK